MPPISMKALEQLGEQTLTVLAPEVLTTPGPVDFLRLVDRDLQKFGIFVYPVHADRLQDRLAYTDAAGTGDINILLSFDLWNDLEQGGRRANRARATVAHELSHAILHVPVLRRRAAHPHAELLLSRRTRRSEIQAFEDPEWQAWALAGCILAPRKTLDLIASPSIEQAAIIYGISEGMLRSHLKRIGMLRRFE